ncbi:S-layer homology domain-containing protein [Pseudoflavonifractor phocaeensis]|uniref:S-layer homology domain-containing protein n=1 Tax=Pseudoflavonifractor phocaeensis TaxID=1870988 RepID=UPI00195B94DB|nr:S-layer homology domain-containing protein [Pseudoflavonifractor phocaeensis]MBM6927133.1 S-layer homology domain-containing protein [Pseudoflavonifractor phocaeensis]
MKLKKKLLSTLLACVLILGMLPVTALGAGSGAPLTTLIVGGTTVINQGIVQTVSGNGWSYADGVLTLNNANLTGSVVTEYENAAIYAVGDLTIQMVGTNTATGSQIQDTSGIGIFINDGSLTVTGDGTLTASGGMGSICPGLVISGRNTPSSLSVTGGHLIAKGGTATGDYGESYGVYVNSLGMQEELTGVKIDVNGGNFSIAGGVGSYNTTGLYVHTLMDFTLSVNAGTMDVTGGVCTGNDGISDGIFANCVDAEFGNSQLSVINGTLTAIGGTGSQRSDGIITSSGLAQVGPNGSLLTNSVQDTNLSGSGSWLVYGSLNGVVNGSFTLSSDLTVPKDARITIPAGATLTVPKDVTLTNNGVISVAEGGTLAVQGKLVDNGVVNGTVTQVPVEQPSSWAAQQVNAAISAGIVPASLQSKYTQTATRAEFCALAVAMYETVTGTEITDRLTFADTSDPNVEKMAALGVVNGTGGNNFSPNDPLNREQAATILARLSDALGKPISASAPTFNDNASISSWAFDSVGQVQAAKIMEGTGGNNFSPAVGYSREQCIITMMRLYDQVK